MADQLSDEEFKSQMIKFVGVANHKFDGLTSDLRQNSYRLDMFEAKLDSLGTEVQHLTLAVQNLAETVNVTSKQFAAVTSKVIENDQRVDSLESRVAVLETH